MCSQQVKFAHYTTCQSPQFVRLLIAAKSPLENPLEPGLFAARTPKRTGLRNNVFLALSPPRHARGFSLRQRLAACGIMRACNFAAARPASREARQRTGG